MEPLSVHLEDRLFCLVVVALASSYLLDCWLQGSLFARCRAYCEARWPDGPFACRLCLACSLTNVLLLYTYLAEGVWKLPVLALAMAWLATRFTSVPDSDPSSTRGPVRHQGTRWMGP